MGLSRFRLPALRPSTLRLSIFFALCGNAVAAEVPATKSGGMPLGAMLQSFFALLLVLGLIVGAAWLLKRTQKLQGNTNAVLKNISALAVGPKERVVVVEVGDDWLVLGVAPGQVRMLHTLPKQALPSGGATTPKFADWLARAKGTTRHGV
jgi:flagellar protein FliO/FliZ